MNIFKAIKNFFKGDQRCDCSWALKYKNWNKLLPADRKPGDKFIVTCKECGTKWTLTWWF